MPITNATVALTNQQKLGKVFAREWLVFQLFVLASLILTIFLDSSVTEYWQQFVPLFSTLLWFPYLFAGYLRSLWWAYRVVSGRELPPSIEESEVRAAVQKLADASNSPVIPVK